MLTFGSLYTGLGAFDYGLTRAGWQCAWTAERDDDLRLRLETRSLWARHLLDAGRALDYGTRVDLVYAELPSADWRDAAPVIETALGLGRALVLEGSPSTWEQAKGRVYVQIADGGVTWRPAARVLRYLDGPVARQRLVVVASPQFDAADLLDELCDLSRRTPAALALPDDWTAGLLPAQANRALAESSSPALGLLFGRALAGVLGPARRA